MDGTGHFESDAKARIPQLVAANADSTMYANNALITIEAKRIKADRGLQADDAGFVNLSVTVQICIGIKTPTLHSSFGKVVQTNCATHP
jgi:hypothetical protein